MKNNTKFLFLGAVLMAMPGILNAQALRGIRKPANLPPANFQGDQYVDFNGCVFIRAGRLGIVSWVPRIDQTRTHICSADFTPTFEKEKKKPVIAALKPKKKDPAQENTDEPVEKVAEASKATASKPKEGLLSSLKEQIVAITAANEAEETKEEAQKRSEVDEAIKKAKQAKRDERAAQAADRSAAAKKAREERARKNKERKEARLAAKAKAKADTAAKIAAADAAAAAKATADAAAKAKSDAAAAKQAKVEADAKAKLDAAAAKQAKIDADAKAKLDAAAKQAKIVADAKAKEDAKAKSDKAAKVAAAKAKAKADAKAKSAAIAAEKKAAAKKKANAPKPLKPGYYVRVASFSDVNQAREIGEWLKASGYKVAFESAGSKTKLFAGPFSTEAKSKAAYYQTRSAGYKSAAIIKR